MKCIIKTTLCSTFKQLKCVHDTRIDTSNCLKPCSGLLVTSFHKSEETLRLENLFPIIGDYNKYKKITPYPAGLTGNDHEHIFSPAPKH